jgi:3-oxoacyl-[acyl-carrier protein] reductase
VEAWNLTLAQEAGPAGVTANVIAPGFTEDTEFFRGGMTDERRSRLIGQTATNRAGTPDDVAALALFLASAGARHVTGQTIHVNGGALMSR